MNSGFTCYTKDLDEEPLFQWCTTWIIRDGKLVSFWFYKWHEGSLRPVSDGMPRSSNIRLSLADALPDIEVLIHSMQELPALCSGQDELVWRWSSTGSYTAKSAYDMLLSGGKVCWGYHKLWAGKCPKTTKKFAYLMFRGRTLTQDVMRRRRIYTM